MNNFLPGEIGGVPVRRAGYDIFEDLPGYQPKPAILGGIFDDPAFQFGLSVLAHNTSKNPAQALMGGMRGLQDFQKQKSADAYNQQMQQYNMTQAETARMKAITDRKKLIAQQKALQDEAESGARMMKAIYGADFTPQVEGDDWSLLPVSDMQGGQLTQGQTGQLGIDFANPNRANAKMFGLTDEDMASIAQIAQSDPKTAMKMVSEAFKSRLRGQKEAKDVIAKERAMAEAMGMPLNEYLRQKMNKSGVQVINQMTPFQEKANEKSGAEFGQYLVKQRENADSAYQTADEIGSVVDMLKGYAGGPWDSVKAKIGQYMPAGSDWNNIASLDQASKSIRSKLAPQMRAVGSGATSDFEMKMWLDAIPSLMMTENGRNIVRKYTERLADRQAAKADIEVELYNSTGKMPSATAVRNALKQRFPGFLDKSDLAFISPGQRSPQAPQAQPAQPGGWSIKRKD